MSWLVLLRPAREQMPFEPTESEAQSIVAADPAVSTGTMAAELRPLRIAVR